jgi:2-iminobutanoate/2-iminopropanoate deaminase
MQTYSHNVSGEREYGFAQAIKVGETIYVSGQLSHDDEGNFIHAYDFDAQVKQVFANLDKVLDNRRRCRSRPPARRRSGDLPAPGSARPRGSAASRGDPPGGPAQRGEHLRHVLFGQPGRGGPVEPGGDSPGDRQIQAVRGGQVEREPHVLADQ